MTTIEKMNEEAAKKPVIYISGPMEGRNDHNLDAFGSAEVLLESLEYRVVNPFDIGVDKLFQFTTNPTRQDFYRKDIRALTYCHAIFMLKGWNQSHGAQFERYVALELGLEIIYEEQVEDGQIVRPLS